MRIITLYTFAWQLATEGGGGVMSWQRTISAKHCNANTYTQCVPPPSCACFPCNMLPCYVVNVAFYYFTYILVLAVLSRPASCLSFVLFAFQHAFARMSFLSLSQPDLPAVSRAKSGAHLIFCVMTVRLA